MKLSPRYKMPFKRRREGKTDYQTRLQLLKSNELRLVVRKSLNYITVQLTEFNSKRDKILAVATSRELKKLGWDFACDNLPAAYLTGLLIGRKSRDKKVDNAILDAGLYPSVKGSRIYAVVKGAKDAGLNIAVDEEVLPREERIKGEHIKKFNSLPSEFEKVKGKIIGG